MLSDEKNADLEFAGIARIAARGLGIAPEEESAADVAIRVEADACQEDEYYEERPLCPYLDPIEMQAAIAMFYRDGLNYVAPEDCNNSLENLIPGCPLISRIDQDMMAAAIAATGPAHAAALSFYSLFGEGVIAYCKALPVLEAELIRLLARDQI